MPRPEITRKHSIGKVQRSSPKAVKHGGKNWKRRQKRHLIQAILDEKVRESTCEVHLCPSEVEAYLCFSYSCDGGKRYVLSVNRQGSVRENELSDKIFSSLWKQFSGWLDNSQITYRVTHVHMHAYSLCLHPHKNFSDGAWVMFVATGADLG